MYSCHHVDPGLSFNRRVTSVTRSIQGQVFIANDQLEIDDRMMATGITKQSYRALLDKHVFFWPTHNDCKKMYDSYLRKQPGNQRAIFKFRAYDFLVANFNQIFLCKYNSGSNPLNIDACTYTKGPHILLPAFSFGISRANYHPIIGSEIREILVEDEVISISHYIDKIYCHNINDLPVKWRAFYENINNF